MHPEADGNLVVRVGGRERDVGEMRHQRFAGRQDLVGLSRHVHREPDISTQLVGEDVERRLQYSCNCRYRAGFRAQEFDLRSERAEVAQHRHRALHEGEVVAVGGHRIHMTYGDYVCGDSREPYVVEESGGIIDELIVLVRLHEGVFLVGFEVLKRRIRRDINARDSVILQTDGLCQSRPYVDHVGDDGVPVEVGGALARGDKGLAEIVGHFLAGESGILGGEFRDERPYWNLVRLFVAHRRDVASEPLSVQSLRLRVRFHVFACLLGRHLFGIEFCLTIMPGARLAVKLTRPRGDANRLIDRRGQGSYT